ncbi:GlsB/YeaQ/YmgE family stress response membrane protein [Croceicoccus gelatinilyticus]|uniref:GlsB/YeaQ/YmgE family stress response membrane protein n=1 Tax=Croceicoccus gelatinilyticus TaxID=2835536 RepID=UPI001BCC8E93|nr:GlsB/YeaQ/YmgE family stress response membrane protein [Croceicoccus gelatinilyticus]MBS7671416.1 GlsB/YeaQ/YmgE family stress response membrane protein [Croceicoccus gelatinilyticus]
MTVLLLLLLGGSLGYATSLLATGGNRDVFVNVILGMLGALTTSHVFSPLFGEPNLFSSGIGALSMLVSIIGAMIVLAIFNLVRLQEAA